MRRSPYLKIISLALIISFSFSNLLYAADPRDLLNAAKAGFALEDQRRTGGEAPLNNQSQGYAQGLVDQKNNLADLEQLNFSLTTQNGDILKYAGDKLAQIQRPDGTILQNIVLAADGKIQNADLKLFDGSIQVFQNGQVIGYETPDGTQVFYANSQIQKTISKSGVETLYAYTKDANGKVLETILENSQAKTIYDAQGKLKEVYQKGLSQRMVYQAGILQSITLQDGSQALFQAQTINSQVKVTFKSYVDANGNTYVNDMQYLLKDGSSLKNIIWGSDGKVVNALLESIDGSTYTFTNKVITAIRLPSNWVLSSITWDTQDKLKDGILTDLANNQWTYQAGALVSIKLLDGSILSSITWDAQNKIKTANLIDAQKKEYTFANNQLSQPLNAIAFQLDTQYGLVAGNSTYQFNWAGKNEKWFKANNNTWYFILPDGKVYLWNSVAGKNLTTSTLVVTLNSSYWEDPAFLCDASDRAIVLQLDTQYSLVPGSSTYQFNWAGQNEKWFKANNNTWYYILPTGQLYLWDAKGGKNLTTSTLAATLNSHFWEDPTKVHLAFERAALESTALNLDRQYALIPSSSNYFLNWAGQQEKWFKSSSGTAQYFILSDGSLYLWNQPAGKNLATSTKLATLSADYWANPTLLCRAYDRTVAVVVTSAYTAKIIGITKPQISVSKRTLSASKLNIATLSAAFSFNSILYNTDGSFAQILEKDNTTLNFKNNLLVDAKDAQGKIIHFDFTESAFGNLLGSSLTQSGATSTYDEQGNLSSVKVGDTTIHYSAENKIESVEKADGTRVENIIFDAQGNIHDAKMTAPDGTQRTYQAKKMIREKKADGTETDFVDGKPSVTRMADGRVYVYSPAAIIGNSAAFRSILTQYVSDDGSAVYVNDGIPFKIQTKSGMVLTNLVFALDGTLTDAIGSFTGPDENQMTLTYQGKEVRQIISADGSRLFYENNRLKSMTKPNGEQIIYEYTLDGDGEILKIILKDASGTRIYNPAFGKSSELVDDDLVNQDGGEVDLGRALPAMDLLSYFKAIENTTTHLPESHVGINDPLTISYTYDVALYLLAGASSGGAILDYIISNPEKMINTTYVPSGGMYSDLSTLGGQAGFDRNSVVAGPNAWIGLAALKQYQKTQDVKYLNFAKARAAFIKTLSDPSGGIVMGPAGQWGIPPFSDLKSTENNLSALYLYQALYTATNDAQYLAAADSLWAYVKTLYDPTLHAFSRGEHKGGGEWLKDSANVFATDVLAWMPFERVVNDSFFGADVLARLKEVENMIRAAEKYTGLFTPVGDIQGFSYSPESKDRSVISIEWSAQMANLYLKIARSYKQLGNDVKYRFYGSRYQKLTASLETFVKTDASGVSRAPYAVYQNGKGAYGEFTGHGWATPSPKNQNGDVFSMASIYYQFSRQKTDPLTLANGSILSANYISQADIDKYSGTSLRDQKYFDAVTSLERYENEKFTAVYSKGTLRSIQYENILINNPVIDARGFLVSAEIHTPDGQVYTLKDRKLATLLRANGTLLGYEGDLIVDVTAPNGKKVHYTYTKNAQGYVTGIAVEYNTGNGWIGKPIAEYLFDPANTEEKPIHQTNYHLAGDDYRQGSVGSSTIGSGESEWFGSAQGLDPLDPEARLVFDSSTLEGTGDRNFIDIQAYRYDLEWPDNMLSVQNDSFVFLRAKETNSSTDVHLSPYWMTASGLLLWVPLQNGFDIPLTDQYQNHLISIQPDALVVGRKTFNLRLVFATPMPAAAPWKISIAEMDYFQLKHIEPEDYLQYLNLSQEQMLDVSRKPLKNDAMDLLEGSQIVSNFNHQKEAEKFLIAMDLDANYNYLSGTRVDKSVERYAGGKVASLLKNGSEETYEYDVNGQIQKVINKDAATQAVKTVTYYQYGRIRRVEDASAKALYTYSYQTDSANNEITLVKDEATGELKHYQGSRLTQMDNADGTRTLYFYENTDERISRSQIMSGQSILAKFSYSYEGANTLVTDADGATKVYDANNLLLSIITQGGLEYRFNHLKDEAGNAVEEQFLYSAKTEDGMTLFYKNDTVDKIQLKDGTVINVSEADQDLYQKVLIKQGLVDQVIHKTGELAVYIRNNRGDLKEVRVSKAGQEYRYTPDGRLVSRTDVGGVTYHYGYILDGAGNISKTRVVKRTAKLIGGDLPTVDPNTGDFLRLSVLSAGIVDGWNAGLFANDEGVGHFDTNFWRNSSDQWTGRGYDVAVVDAKGKLIKSDLFDIWQLGGSEADRMAQFIEQVPVGNYVLMAVGDEGALNMTERAYKALESLGSAQIRNLKFRGSWGLIGRKGAAIGTAIEGLRDSQKGYVSLQNYDTEYSYFDKKGVPIPYDQFTAVISQNWNSSYQSYVGDAGEILKTSVYSDEYAIAYHKNYNELYPDSGFIQLWNDRYLNQFTVNEYAQGIIDKVSTTATAKYVYYDSRYPFNYVHPLFAVALKNILAANGFRVIDANQLAEVMKLEGSHAVIVSAHDVMPDTIYDPNSIFSISYRKLSRTFMENGGTLVWMGDLPFYYTGHADGSKTIVGEIGAKTVLGVMPLARGLRAPVSRTYVQTFDEWTFISGWIHGNGATIQNGTLRLTSQLPSIVGSASDQNFKPSTGLLRYTVDFKNNTLNSGFETYLEFQNFTPYQTLGIRQENGVFKFIGKTPVTGGSSVITNLGQAAYVAGVEYTVIFETENNVLKVFLYQKNQPQPEVPTFSIANVDPSVGASIGFNIQQGEALVTSLKRDEREYEIISTQAPSITPDFSLKGGEAALDTSLLYFDTNVNFRTVRWDKIQESIGYSLDSDTAVVSDYDKNGDLISIAKADRTVTTYENQKVQLVTDINGYVLVEYAYDAQGALTSITNVGQRRELADHIEDAKDRANFEKLFLFEDVAIEHNLTAGEPIAKSARIRSLAHSANVLDGGPEPGRSSMGIVADELISEHAEKYRQENPKTLEGEVGTDPFWIQVADGYLAYSSARLEALKVLRSTQDIKAKSRDAKKEKSKALDRVRDIIRDIDNRENEYHQTVLQAIFNFSAAVLQQKKNEIEADYQKAFDALAVQTSNFEKEIQKEESKPVISDYYRSILGRDATSAEIESYYPQIAQNGKINAAALGVNLRNSAEFIQRTSRVGKIRGDVEAALDEYVSADTGKKATLLASLGLTPSEVVNLSAQDIQKIKDYLRSQALHFGESAIESLMALIKSRGISPNRDELAAKLILIDIFAGIIHPYLKEGEEMLLSAYSLQKVAAFYGVEAQTLNLTYEDMLAIFSAGTSSARAILHTEGIHYSVLTAITADQVTILEYNGDSRTMSKADFLKSWKGVALVEKSTAAPVLTGPQKSATARVLNSDEARQIKGGFFMFIPFIFTMLAHIAATIGAIIASIGTIIAQIGIMVGQILQGLGGLLYQFAQGVGAVVKGLWTGIKFVGMKIFTGFAKFFGPTLAKAAAGEALKVTVGQTILNNVIRMGVSYVVSKGLDALGVDPIVTSIISTFVTGGMHGGFTSQGFNFGFSLADGLKAGLQLGAKTFLQAAGLDPQLSGILSMTTGPLVNGVWTGNVGGELFKIAPELTTSLAQYGIDKLGKSLGLDPRLTGLISAPISLAIGKNFQTGNIFGQDVIKAVQDGIFRGAIAYGVDFAANRITDNKLLQALSSRLISGAIEGTFLQKDLFAGVVGALKQSVVGIFGANQSDVLGNIVNFSTLVAQNGFKNAAELYLTNIFNKQSIEAIYRLGGIASALASPKTQVTLPDGRVAYQTVTSSGEAIIFDAMNNLLGFQRNGLYQIGGFGITSAGSFGLISGKSFGMIAGGSSFEASIQNGKVTQITTYTDQVRLDIDLGEGTDGIRFDSDGNLTDGRMTLDERIDFTVVNGTVYGIELDKENPNTTSVNDAYAFAERIISAVLDGSGSSSSGSSVIDQLQKELITYYLFGNGFENERRKEDTLDPLLKFYTDNLEFDDPKVITEGQKIVVDLYEFTKVAGNGLDWLGDFNPVFLVLLLGVLGLTYVAADRIIQKVINNESLDSSASDGEKSFYQKVQDYLRKFSEQTGLGNNLVLETIRQMEALQAKKGKLKDAIAFVHSGATAPVLSAIEQMQYDVETVLIYEGPHPNYTAQFTNPSLKRIIHVMGSSHGLLDSSLEGDAPVPFLGWANFKNPANVDFKNINIEIEGAWHSDYAYNAEEWDKKIAAVTGSTPTAVEADRNRIRALKERNRKVNLFMRDLYQAAYKDQTNQGLLDDFFEDLKTKGAANLESGIWKIDPTKLRDVTPQ